MDCGRHNDSVIRYDVPLQRKAGFDQPRTQEVTHESLYENAIVINAMVEELSALEHKASLNPGYYEEDLIKKSIALGEYRMIALDNVYRYQTATGANKNSYKKVINKERFIIQNSIDQLRMRQEMLEGN